MSIESEPRSIPRSHNSLLMKLAIVKQTKRSKYSTQIEMDRKYIANETNESTHTHNTTQLLTIYYWAWDAHQNRPRQSYVSINLRLTLSRNILHSHARLMKSDSLFNKAIRYSTYLYAKIAFMPAPIWMLHWRNERATASTIRCCRAKTSSSSFYAKQVQKLNKWVLFADVVVVVVLLVLWIELDDLLGKCRDS